MKPAPSRPMPIANGCASKGSEPVSTIPMRGPVSLQVPGFPHHAQLCVHDERDRVIAPAVLRDHCWERDESELLCRLLEPGDCVLDIGANIGYFTVLAASMVGPEGQVWAFEPEPLNSQLLGHNLHINGLSNVQALAVALGKSTGTVPLFLSGDNAGDHSLGRLDQQASITVPMVRGDDVLPADLRVQLIKMDVQGA
ncbi:MAG: FkbM family methyltransferase, partial [Gammaproteobacteria bacterium]